jgi:putative PIN family toxin of toxin-antitoxin system
VIRAVLDTNVVISALLFSGPPSQLVAWQSNSIRLIVSAPILEEYIRVLAYPKFKLTSVEIRALIEEELLPFVETVKVTPSAIVPVLRDSDDAKFITCATTASVRWLVSGDQDLLALHRVKSVEIISVTEFLQRLNR